MPVGDVILTNNWPKSDPASRQQAPGRRILRCEPLEAQSAKSRLRENSAEQTIQLLQEINGQTSLVVQCLRIHLTIQGTQVRSLVGELRSHVLWGNQAHEPQLLSPHITTESASYSESACTTQ